jgi:hypothetical protein
MTTQKQEFQSHNSPWTEMYDMYCEREDTAATAPMQNPQEEQQPTLSALANVYNRDDAETQSKRF